ncbi:hypothetical protein NKI65_30490 [Mesorhizobium sp. M0578]
MAQFETQLGRVREVGFDYANARNIDAVISNISGIATDGRFAWAVSDEVGLSSVCRSRKLVSCSTHSTISMIFSSICLKAMKPTWNPSMPSMEGYGCVVRIVASDASRMFQAFSTLAFDAAPAGICSVQSN